MPPDESPDLAALSRETATLAGGFRDAATAGRASLAGIAESARAARAELARTTEAGKTLSQSLSSGLDRAFRSALKDGAKLSDILRTLALDISRSIASKAIGGLTDSLSGAIGNAFGGFLPFAKGAAFDAGRVRAFAKGGIVCAPTLFPMAGGNTGLMGESGPEAVMPLQRTPDGRLGIAAQGQGGANVNVTILTQDAASFHRSRTQVAATLARAVDRGRRNL